MSGAAKRPTLAGSLNRLFDDLRPEGPRGRRYTNEEVAAAIKRENPHVRVGGAYISALRKGTKKHPSTDLVTALSRFFGVPVAYFLDDATGSRTLAELELARLAHHHPVRRLALRALELSPEGLSLVAELIERVLADDRATRRPSASH